MQENTKIKSNFPTTSTIFFSASSNINNYKIAPIQTAFKTFTSCLNSNETIIRHLKSIFLLSFSQRFQKLFSHFSSTHIQRFIRSCTYILTLVLGEVFMSYNCSSSLSIDSIHFSRAFVSFCFTEVELVNCRKKSRKKSRLIDTISLLCWSQLRFICHREKWLFLNILFQLIPSNSIFFNFKCIYCVPYT